MCHINPESAKVKAIKPFSNCNIHQYHFTSLFYRYGCTYCLDAGENVSRRHIYPPDQDHQPRSTRDVMKWAKEAEQLGKPVFGVKGASVLSKSLDVVKSVPIDYMHAVLEGVAKSLMSYWFESQYHGKRFYLKSQVHEIDKMLLRIKPSYDIPRAPRSIAQNLKYWKASEYRAWLLFYALPILKSFLPSDYVYHLSLLVSAIHIFLSTGISHECLLKAEQMLQLFYQLVPELYPKELCTMNVHSLIHLTDCVRRWGPLWSFSCFGFENMNGFLKKHCHATRNVLPQLIRALETRQSLPSLQKNLAKNENGRTMAFLSKIGSFDKIACQYPSSVPLGKIKVRKPTEQEVLWLSEAGFETPPSVSVFTRYRINRLVVQARDSCKSNCVRNNSVCLFTTSGSSASLFGSVKTLFGIGDRHVAIVCVYESTEEDILFDIPAPQHRQLRSCTIDNFFVSKVKKLSLSNRNIAIPVTDILARCIHIPIKHSPTEYIITLPNTFEHH